MLQDFRLIEIDWPKFNTATAPIPVPGSLHAGRIVALRNLLESQNFTHAVVYADREHFANLHFLTHFDPRFEEALLLLSTADKPLMLVGNECKGYLPISPLWKDGELRHEVYQPFSLPGQPRNSSRLLEEIFRSEGIGTGSRIAVIGSKCYERTHQSDVPAYLIDALRGLAGFDAVENTTGWLIHPENGLRTISSGYDIAVFEQNNVKASEAMRRMHFALRTGITDHELMAETVQYDGTPLSCHMTCKTGPKRISLASPSGNRIEMGHTWSANVAYWGSNICRANWIARDERDLPPGAKDYLGAFVGPYFLAMAEWLEALDLGVSCGPIHDRILERLPFDTFHIELNPGHHISYDEWPGSSFYPGSEIPLRSGMVLQSDVIPSHPVYFSTRMEDGYALADQTLRAELAAQYPQAWARIQERRTFLGSTLGIQLKDCVLPLSNMAGIIAPYGLMPQKIFAR